uniref:ATP synthase subunit a n=1 Tax=Leucophytia bidentata TaxID=999262 RepID=G8HMU7_9EUPU|nr:ATP synthase F0 subunit 6 [Leucophytia bidentata]AEQ93821.1 ATP synthase subunit 6 [Leucophytia bidentata]
MFSDLFSSLDGCTSLWSWGPPLVLCVVFYTNSSWVLSSVGLSKTMFATFIEGKKELMPLPLFLFGLMFLLACTNLVGLVPFVYGVTSSLWFASTLALTMWGLLIFSGWLFAPKASAANLAPSGAPTSLLPFLVLIETVSVVIRPLTLTVRLIANISAGHIVLALVANCLTGLGLVAGMGVFLVGVGYTLFEVFVCVIQAYIFTLLVSLYVQEHP